MARARISNGNISLTLSYAAPAAEDGTKKITVKHMSRFFGLSAPFPNGMHVMASSAPAIPQVAVIIGLRPTESKNLASLDGPNKVPQCKRQKVHRSLFGLYFEELVKHQTIWKEQRIMKERLRNHQACAVSCAKMCWSAGGELEQIQLLLGHKPRSAISELNRIYPTRRTTPSS